MSVDVLTRRYGVENISAIIEPISSVLAAAVMNDNLPRETSSACDGPEMTPIWLNGRPDLSWIYSNTVVYFNGMMPLMADMTYLPSNEPVYGLRMESRKADGQSARRRRAKG